MTVVLRMSIFPTEHGREGIGRVAVESEGQRSHQHAPFMPIVGGMRSRSARLRSSMYIPFICSSRVCAQAPEAPAGGATFQARFRPTRTVFPAWSSPRIGTNACVLEQLHSMRPDKSANCTVHGVGSCPSAKHTSSGLPCSTHHVGQLGRFAFRSVETTARTDKRITLSGFSVLLAWSQRTQQSLSATPVPHPASELPAQPRRSDTSSNSLCCAAHKGAATLN